MHDDIDREAAWLGAELNYRIRDAERKQEALKHLEKALAAAGVYVSLEYRMGEDHVLIQYLRSDRPVRRVNIHTDSTAAMLYDICHECWAGVLIDGEIRKRLEFIDGK